MKKILFGLICFTLYLCSMDVSAATYESISVGTNYKGKWPWDTGIDSSVAATISATAFKKFGYTGYLSTTPNAAFFQGKTLTNSSYILETPIIHLAGHGDSNGMYFKYYNSADHETAVVIGNTSTVNGITYVGIGNYNMSNVRLFIFQGCNTATGDNNIAKNANAAGAKVTLGWYDLTSTTSNEQWISRFSQKLSEANVSVNEAVSYANSFSYSDANSKKVRVYGNGTLKLSAGMGMPQPFSLTVHSDEKNDSRKTYSPFQLMVNEENFFTKINEYIINNINANHQINDFELIKINDSLYDLSYRINGTVRTDMGYVIELNNGTITKIYNNMKPIMLKKDLAMETTKINSFQYTVGDSNGEFIIDNIEEFDFYNADKKIIEHIARVTIRDLRNNSLGVYDEVLS